MIGERFGRGGFILWNFLWVKSVGFVMVLGFFWVFFKQNNTVCSYEYHQISEGTFPISPNSLNSSEVCTLFWKRCVFQNHTRCSDTTKHLKSNLSSYNTLVFVPPSAFVFAGFFPLWEKNKIHWERNCIKTLQKNVQSCKYIWKKSRQRKRRQEEIIANTFNKGWTYLCEEKKYSSSIRLLLESSL